MNQTDHTTRWQQFLTRFYAPPNELELTETNRALQNLTTRAYKAWIANTPMPFFVPAKLNDKSCCYVLCVSGDQQIWVRDVIRAYLGSWITFDELDSSPTGSPLDEAVAELIGTQGCRYIFWFPSDGDAPQQVINGIRRLTEALASRPNRRVELNRTPGRLIGEFWDACAASSEDAARELLDTLAGDPRLSRINALFLRVQALATFERWDQIEELDQLDDLLRMQRPARVSDALARLAMAQLPQEGALTTFDQHKARYGALVDSVTAIRSPAGAQYYTYWCLSAGESPATVRSRLLDAGWLEKVQQSSVLNDLLLDDQPVPHAPRQPLDRDALNNSLADGRLDAAIALMAAATPTADALGILHDLVLKTLSPEALSVLQSWRDVIGDVPSNAPVGLQVAEGSAAPHYATFDEAVREAFSPKLSAERRQHARASCRESAVAALMRPGAFGEFTQHLRDHAEVMNVAAGETVDLLLDIERDVYAAAHDHPGLQDLRLLTIETWAYSDESGDRHRASRIIVMLDRLLTAGVSVNTYDEVVDLLLGAWTSYLTDADAPMGLETIEILAAKKPDASIALNAFALPVLSRIGEHNLHRLGPSTLDAARMLAPEFDIAFAPSVSARDDESSPSSDHRQPPDDTFIAIYSLLESAALRAKRALNERFPRIRVEIFNDKVATDPLKSAGRTADILVIADRAAAHAATNALVSAREGKTIDYARGKGTASLLDAVDRGFQRLLSDSSVAVA